MFRCCIPFPAVRTVDLESSVVYISAQFIVNNVNQSPAVDVTAVYDLEMTPLLGHIPDGSNVTFVLSVYNAAGSPLVQVGSVTVDRSPPVCSAVQFVGAAAANGVVALNPGGLNATLTAQVRVAKE